VLRHDVDAVVVPVLDRHEREVGTVLDDDLDVLGPGGRAVVVDDHDSARELSGAHQQVPGTGLVDARAVKADRRGLVDHGLGRDRHLEHGGGRGPGTGRHAIDRHVARGAARRVGDGHRHGGHAGSGVNLDRVGVAVERRVLVQVAQALERREPPDLLETRRDGVIIEVEGTLGVEV
jgi:hypothetical protein